MITTIALLSVAVLLVAAVVWAAVLLIPVVAGLRFLSPRTDLPVPSATAPDSARRVGS